MGDGDMGTYVKRYAACLFLVMWTTTAAHGAVWYVTPTGAGSGNGTSWENAGTLQAVVNAAVSGDEVWVKAGTYTSASNPVLTMKAGVNVYGGFAGTETRRNQRVWVVHETIIDGENVRRCVGAWNSGGAVLDGFTIARGWFLFEGGGMAYGTAINCTFTSNVTEEFGGGMYQGTAINCTFTSNVSQRWGGGMYQGTAINCTFTSNVSEQVGGAMAWGTAINCTFVNNTARIGGGGIYNATAINCIFVNNSAYDGGAMDGGTATNCTFTGNRAERYGGAMAWGTATNCIFWDNSPDQVYNTTATYSCVQGGYGGAGNIDADPRFVNIWANDLRLLGDSPCIDTGTFTGAPDHDIRGVPRPQGAEVDMGAYEMGFCVITLIGATPLTVECGSSYYDPGATAWDEYAGDITAGIVTDNPVNTSVPGEYTLRYNVVGSGGITAAEVTRTVHVVDTQPPFLSLLGANPLILECGDTYLSPGAFAWDACDGLLSDTIAVDADTLDIGIVGIYQVTYSIQDAHGNSASAYRSVEVVDTQLPIISITGANPVVVECGDEYTDEGATADDACYGDLTEHITTFNPVNTSITGVYTVTYNVTDGADNAAVEVTRTVTVADTIPPVITTCADDQTVNTDANCHAAVPNFTTGVVASDNCGIASITQSPVAGTLAGVGDTFVTITVTDTAGLTANCEATLTVTDTTPPVITLTGEAVMTLALCPEDDVTTLPGVTALDACEGDLTADILVGGDTLSTEPGVYVITYNVSDSAGNATLEVTRTVQVQIPEDVNIVLDALEITVECGDLFEAPEAEVRDGCGDAFDIADMAGTVDTLTPGEYMLVYSYPETEDVTLIVTVLDTLAPVITLAGEETVLLEDCEPYQEAGLESVLDACDGDLGETLLPEDVPVRIWVEAQNRYVHTTLAFVEEDFNVLYASRPGSYILTYSVEDSTGNTGTIERTIVIACMPAEGEGEQPEGEGEQPEGEGEQPEGEGEPEEGEFPPVATCSFDAEPTQGNAPLTVLFQNSSQYAASVVWYFGDGNESNEWSPSHTYEAPGEYEVELYVFCMEPLECLVTCTETILVGSEHPEGEGEGEQPEGEGEPAEGEGEQPEGEGEQPEGEGEQPEGEGEQPEGEGEQPEGEGEQPEGEGEQPEGEGEQPEGEGEGEPAEGEGEQPEGEGVQPEGEGEPAEGEPIQEELERLAEELLDLFDGADTDGDGRISYAEALNVMPTLTPAQFASLDRNSDGYLTREELLEWLPEAERCGCCRRTPASTETLKRYLGDWLLMGMALIALLALTTVRRKL
jgi:hypothetical protein